MTLTLEGLRDNVERLLAKVNDETHERLGLPKVEVVGTRHHLPKPDHPLETRRHIGDTARSTARRSRTARSKDPLSKSQKVAAMQRKLERTRAARKEAEERVTELRREVEVLATGYSAYGRLKRDAHDRISTARREELVEIKREYDRLGLEHERRRVLAHAEADKKAFMASLKK